MTKYLSTLRVIAVAGLVFSAAAVEQGMGSPGEPTLDKFGTEANGGLKIPAAGGTAAVISMNNAFQIRARDELFGAMVVSRDGDNVGRVEDLILDQGGKVEGYVISSGGFFGVGATSIGISAKAVDVSNAKDRNAVRVNLSKEELEEATGVSGR